MMKKIVSVCITGILVYGICGCAQTAENTPYAGTETVETENTEIESEEKTHTGDAETTVKGEENRHSGEGIVSPESVDEQGETGTESEDILREIEEYRSHFIGLYTTNALTV